MSFIFKPAVREQTSLIIVFSGPSGGGKTKSALRLATGLANGGKIAFIDTENGRGLHYADQFKYDYCELSEPFSPARYADAIKSADDAGYAVIVLDSFSHSWNGSGGCQDMHDAVLDRMAGSDWNKRERLNVTAWGEPKQEHKRMMQHLLQTRAHIILCLRAEEKIKMVKDEKGKIQIVPIGWQPICEKNVPFEATVSCLLLDEKPGVPVPIKLQDQHKHAFPEGRQINEETGKALAAWAAGGKPVSAPQEQKSKPIVLFHADREGTPFDTAGDWLRGFLDRITTDEAGAMNLYTRNQEMLNKINDAAIKKSDKDAVDLIKKINDHAFQLSKAAEPV